MMMLNLQNLAVPLLLSEKNTETDNKNTEKILIDSAKQGDARAFEVLAGRYKRLLEWYVRQLRLPVSETEDFLQEGLIGLLKAVRTYDGKSSSFNTYASVCIRRNIISAVRKFNKNYNTLVPYEDNIDDKSQTTSSSPESDFINRESVKILYDKVSSVLSKYELIVFDMYLSDMSYGDMSKKLDRQPKSVSNAVYRIRKKLKQTIKPNR
ncbi:MAG: sigma-70 family RNA polymerase sigma factor [Eubacteriales bacterium]|nr:sigma-70 family RNA polymerase sigma factor [Eubacteriales bacterium]